MSATTVSFTEVDGVPTYHCPGAGGPTRALLQFRVGHADEDLPQRGITHMVEHLTLHQFGGEIHHNGFTGPNVTGFVVEGDAERVRSFLAGVTGALRELPTDRLEVERDVLRAEEAQRSWGLHEELLIWRYGLVSFGASASEEYGVRKFEADDLRAWSTRFFTRGNATLWLIGDVPQGLRLDLPDGVRLPSPNLVELQEGPSWYPSRYRGGAGSSLVPRSYATTAYAELLDHRLKERLRFESGKSYAPQVSLERRDATWAEISFSADALEENLAEVANGVVAVVEEAKEGGFDEADLARYHERIGRLHDDPRYLEAFTMAAAHADLLGSEITLSIAQAKAASGAVTLDEVNAVAAQAWTKVLLAMSGAELNRADVARIAASSGHAVFGVPHRLRDPGAGKTALVVGDKGITLSRDDEHTSVLFDQQPVLLAWDDGKRTIVGRDGFQIVVEPNIWTGGDQVVTVLDGAVEDGRTIPMGGRDPSEIPPAPAPPPSPRHSRTRLAAMYIVFGLILVTVFGAIAVTANLPVFWMLAVIAVWRLARSWNRELR